MRHTDNETPSRGILLFTSLNQKTLIKIIIAPVSVDDGIEGEAVPP